MELREGATGLMRQSIAPSTQAVYGSAINAYIKYCLLEVPKYSTPKLGLPPVSEEILITFATHCFTTLNVQHSTIKLYKSGIRFHYLLDGHSQLDFANMHRLQILLRGIKRNSTPVVRPRHPITGDILKALCKKLDAGLFGRFTDVMLKTVYITAFFGFLRCGEFTCLEKFEPESNLCVSDLELQENPVSLHLKQSKTDPFRKGMNIQLFCNGSAICPQCQLKHYMEVRRVLVPISSCREPLFVTQQGSPLSRTIFLDFLKHTFQATNIPHENFSGHSFRIGAATSASATSLIGDHMIKTLGRWNSDSYCRYIRTPMSAIHQAQIQLASTCFQ